MVIIKENGEIIYKDFRMSFYDDGFFRSFVEYLEGGHETELEITELNYNSRIISECEIVRLLIDGVCICCNPEQRELKAVIEDILEQLELEIDIVLESD